MVNELDVLEALKQIANVGESDYQQTVDLCRQCFESLKKELKAEVNTEDPRVINAAAADAFYLMCIKEKNAHQGGVTSFKAGDMSITQSDDDIDGRLKSAEKLCTETRKKLIPLFEDKGFFAGAVDV